jgi:hypothetical protein
VPVSGGAVTTERLEGMFALSAWPWVTSSAAARPGPVELRALGAGQRRDVPAKQDEILACSPTWCRVTTLIDGGRTLVIEAERIDGSARQRTGDTGMMPALADVALLDRFEVFASAPPANVAGIEQRLWLHDLTTQRPVLLDDYATASVSGRGGYLWWSSGDNEALTWHILDLRTLA